MTTMEQAIELVSRYTELANARNLDLSNQPGQNCGALVCGRPSGTL